MEESKLDFEQVTPERDEEARAWLERFMMRIEASDNKDLILDNLSEMTPEKWETITNATEYIVQESLAELEDDIKKAIKKDAYDSIMKLLNDAEVKIDGKNFSQTNLDRFNEISLICFVLFSRNPTNARIEAESPSQEKPFNAVHVETDFFEITEKNKELFQKLISLADNIIFNSEKNEVFSFSFYVNDIWTE